MDRSPGVRSAEDDRLAAALGDRGLPVVPEASGALVLHGVPARVVGAIAAEHGVALVELVAESRSLEDTFLELTAGDA